MEHRSHQPIQFVRKATKVGGGSLAVVIPNEIVDALGIRERQKLSLTLDGDQVVVTDWESDSKERT